MRIFELGKQLDIPSKELIELCEMLGIEVKNHMSGLTEEQVAEIIEAATGEVKEFTGDQPADATDADASTDAGEAEPSSAEEEPVESSETGEASGDAVEESPAAEAEAEPEPEPEPEPEGPPVLDIFSAVVVKDLAVMVGMKPNQIIAELMKMNIFASINQNIAQDVAVKLARNHGFEVRTEKPKPPPPPPPPVEEKPAKVDEEDTVGSDVAPKAPRKKKKKNKDGDSGEEVVDKDAATRPPVVTFLGHVDHGKTSLLDRIRQANVVSDEAGGITQHIGAYTVSVGDHEITFMDTPGHAAFSAMRARGADLTDIAVIVVSAEESLKPQTLEAIDHAKAAEVTIMIAANKMDLPNANLDRVKTDLQKIGMPTEDWGGDVILVPVSAATGAGVDELLEMINLQAEILELKARPNGKAEGFVIEAQMEPGMGATASVLITEGTLKTGDAVVCGDTWGRIKALIDHTGARVKTAGPSHAVKILGLNDVPSPGDRFDVYKNDREARRISEELQEEKRVNDLQGPERKASLDDLFAAAGLDDLEELCVLLKCDVKGSLEALISSLEEIKSDKIRLKIVSSGIGAINENDVLLANASNAILIGFNVGKDNASVKAAKREGVEIRLYDIIYELLDEVRAAMTGMLKPVIKERIIGHAEIRAIFKLNRAGNVAGSMVIDGRVRSTARARVLRGREVIYLGAISSLKRFQDEVSEVGNGQECGIRLENFNNFETGDVIEVYETDKVKQEL